MDASETPWSCETCAELDTNVSARESGLLTFRGLSRRPFSLTPPSYARVTLLAAGEVYEVGPGVEGLKKGDRVAIEAGLPCGECEECRLGRYNACKDVVFFSTPPFHGLLTRYHAHPASWIHRLPDTISFEEGALLEPLAVALAGIERANLRLGDPLLIW